jgi:hypothetical protein
MDVSAANYYSKRISELARLAEDEAARSNFQAAIYKLTDALDCALNMLQQMAGEAEERNRANVQSANVASCLANGILPD